MLSVSLIPILCVFACAMLLGLITWASNRTRITNQIFALLSLASGAYTLTNKLADVDQSRAQFWSQATFCCAALMLLCLLLFINNFPRKTFSRSFEMVAVVIGLLVGASSFLPSFLSVSLKTHKTEITPGQLYPIFLLYIAVYLAATFFIYRKNIRAVSGVEQVRMRYVFAGFSITAILLLWTNLILPLLTGNNDLSGLGSYFILVFIGFSTYAIIKQRLFNLRMLAARSATYSLLLLTVALAYAYVLALVSRVFLPNEHTSINQSTTTTILALILAFTFQPLRSFFEKLTDRIFYRDHYDSQEVLNNFSKILVSELELNHILKKAVQALCESLHVQFGQVIVFDNGRVYRIEHFGPLPKRLMIAPELARLGHAMIVADELEGGERKELLDNHGIRISMTLRTRNEFVGHLLLGDKLSGGTYSSQDIELLEIIGKQLAVAILNAKAYAEIQEFNLTLQARVDHATNRLRVANRHLKELDHAKDEFISMASHQLRTPLTTIKGYLSMLQEGDAGKLTKAQNEFVGYAFGSSERMVNLISDLLNVSRLSAGRFLIQTKPTDMVQMIEDEVRQLQTHATTKGLNLVFDHPANPLPPAQIDENKTRQVIMNFIDNAIYYTQKGEVRVVLDQTVERVRMEVRDTGIGVPDDARRKLFSKFFRAGNAQTVRPDGTGLGLYLAKRVVEDQGGTIIFSSVEGKGSTFGFELPTEPQPSKHKDDNARPK